jgi:hypothetical protein
MSSHGLRSAAVFAVALSTMDTGPVGWLPIIATSASAILAGGAAGAIITTYGGKARERRQARSDVITTLSRIEIARLSQQADHGPSIDVASIAELETKCMLAGVPRELSVMYKSANDRWRESRPPATPPAEVAGLAYIQAMITDWIALQTIERSAELLTNALWHPWLSRPLRHWHVRKLEQRINAVSGRRGQLPSRDNTYRMWRQVSGRLTKRDRAADSIRGWLHLRRHTVIRQLNKDGEWLLVEPEK